MALNIAGLVAVLFFYALILGMGVWASRKSRREEKKCVGSKTEVTMIGGRNMNIWIGICTMTATWVGGGYIMGTAEAVYTPSCGVIWAIGPPTYFVTFLVGGLFFAKEMRSKRYVTMMDPFQHRYGNTLTTALLLPTLLSDIMWVACILGALGGTVSVILDLHSSYAIVLSAGVAITYTLLGGMYSVAYTDVIQLLIIFISLWLCVPFVILHPSSSSSSLSSSSNVTLTPLHSPPAWLGELKTEDVGKWIDEFLVLSLGPVAFQPFYQRVLSAASPAQAQITCFASMIISFILGIPSLIIGAVAVSADWNQTEYGLPPPFERGEAGNVLPLALQNLTPTWVSVLGIGALAAAVMSTVDSALLSSASMFTQNIYKSYLRKQASEKECAWVIRLSVLLVGLAGTGLAFTGEGVLAFWILSPDISYCMVFPQIVCVVHCPFANGYGATTGFVLGTFLRLLSGVPALHIPPVLMFPGWREDELTGDIHQYFPFKSLIMLLHMLIIPSASLLARLVFTRHMLPPSWDVFGVLRETGNAVKGVNGAGRAEVILPGATETTEKMLVTSTSSC